MIKHVYGYFSSKQMAAQKEALHNAIHWLLLYKENAPEQLEEYFAVLLPRVSGLNDLLRQPPQLVTLLSLLQAIRNEHAKPDCSFKLYRRLVFDAHSAIDKIEVD